MKIKLTEKNYAVKEVVEKNSFFVINYPQIFDASIISGTSFIFAGRIGDINLSNATYTASAIINSNQLQFSSYLGVFPVRYIPTTVSFVINNQGTLITGTLLGDANFPVTAIGAIDYNIVIPNSVIFVLGRFNSNASNFNGFQNIVIQSGIFPTSLTVPGSFNGTVSLNPGTYQTSIGPLEISTSGSSINNKFNITPFTTPGLAKATPSVTIERQTKTKIIRT